MPRNSTSRVLLAGTLWLALCSCERRKPPPQKTPDTTTQQACRAACAQLVTLECPAVGTGAPAQRSCVSACDAESRMVEPLGCAARFRGYLACVAQATLSCDGLACSAERCVGQGIAPCKRAYSEYRECAAPCFAQGERRRHRTKQLSFETIGAGCARCPEKMALGAAPGSACESESVCQQYCCTAATGVRVLSRACADGACAAEEQACQVAWSED